MKKIIILILVLLISQTVNAKELDPDTKFPKWINEDCLNTIYKIVQHESGSMQDSEVFQFMTEQIVRDVQRLGCENLTIYRWAIGEYPLYKVTPKVKENVLVTIYRHPKKDFPECKFIGMEADIPIWKSYGYDTIVGYKRTIGKFTIIGVGCKH